MSNSERSIPFAVPDIGSTEIEAVTKVLDSRWLTTGSVTHEFESQFGKRVDAPYAVALNSCTAALHLSLEALGVGCGDAVFLPTYTFAATGEVVRYVGAEPVLVDIEPGTACIDPEDLRRRIEDVRDAGVYRPRAIIPVHYAGVSADLGQIWELARAHDLCVVEDAAHAFPSAYDGRPIGWTPEDVASTVCFSFYATKTITTGEGGMVTTRDPEVAERIRLMSLHGLSKQAWNRYGGGSWRYDIVAPGYKYNLTDIAAALGLAQLSRAESMTSRRRAIAASYSKAFQSLDRLRVPPALRDRSHAWHLYHLRLDPRYSTPVRDQVIESLHEDYGVRTSVHFIPLHMHSYYMNEYGYQKQDFPVAVEVFERSLSLPLYSSMTDADVHQVVDAVRCVHEQLLVD